MNAFAERVAQTVTKRRHAIALAVGSALLAVLLTLVVVRAVEGEQGSARTTPIPVAQELYAAPDLVEVGGASWRAVADEGVTVSAGSTTTGEKSATFDFAAGREKFTVAQLTFEVPQDWSSRQFLFLEFRGSASGAVYTFFVDFQASHANSASYRVVDTASGWTVVPFEIGTIAKGRKLDAWARVISVRITTDSKNVSGAFDLGTMRLSSARGK